MEGQSAKWIIRGNELLDETAATSIRSYLNMLYDQVDKDDQRPVVPLSLGDPSAFSCFRTSPEAEDAIVRAVQSAEFNSYAPINGILPARSPGNPCGNVFSYHHLNKVAETARKLGIFVIADEVYAHLAFGNNPYGWRFGWIAACDPNGILKKYGIVDSIKSYFNISTNPATFVQAAIPQIFEKTKDDFFSKTINIMREAADVFHEKTKEIPCVTCPHKPDGSMFAMVKLNLSLLEDISDDTDFCLKLAREESVTVLPGKP
ncbi:hypothetical protein OIU78_025567 [Salix suchowensis]|nr:hypothetical protein OIU78_025567 [Salix suchowensis]